LVVRDKYGGDADFVMELAQPFAEVFANFRVEGAKGFIEEQDAGLNGESACECNALALSTAEFGRESRLKAVELHHFEEFARLAPDCFR
jgi:hypothetical protein